MAQANPERALRERPPWKTVQLGTHGSLDLLRQELIMAGCMIDDMANDMFNSIIFASQVVEIDLYWAGVTELFDMGHNWREIRSMLDHYGFGNCPQEVAPQLRRQFLEQKIGESYWIVSRPIGSRLFSVSSERNGLWLRGYEIDPQHRIAGDSKIVFCNKSQLAKIGP